jgi:hypothetical protein
MYRVLLERTAVSDARFARRGLLVRPDAACLQWSASTSTRPAQIAVSNFDSFQKRAMNLPLIVWENGKVVEKPA